MGGVFTEVTRARQKAQLLYAGCMHFTEVWTDCFETYMVVT